MKLIPKYQQGGDTYVVKKGDSPWKISHDNGISLDELYRLNPFAREMIHPNNGNFIYINNAIKKQAGPKQYQFNWDDLYKDRSIKPQRFNWLKQ